MCVVGSPVVELKEKVFSASECLDVKNYKWWLNPVWHRMLYSCTHMATVGLKVLIFFCVILYHVICCNLILQQSAKQRS